MSDKSEKIAIPSAEFIRNIGRWQSEALRQPIIITHHGRDRLILAAPDLFQAASERSEQDDDRDVISTLRLVHQVLLENIQEGYLGLDARGNVVAANSAATAYLGRSANDLLGMTVADVFPELLALLISDRVQRVLRTRTSEAFESSSADGRSISVRVLPASEGAVVLFQNTTEQRRLQHEHEASNALAVALDELGEASRVRLDGRGRIEFSDQNFCQWSGFAAPDIVGHRLADLMPPADRRQFSLAFEQSLRDVSTARVPLMLLGRRGEELSAIAAIAPIQADYVARGAMVVLLKTDEQAVA